MKIWIPAICLPTTMQQIGRRIVVWILMLFYCGTNLPSAASTPPPYSYQFIYLVPNDQQPDPKAIEEINKEIELVRDWFRAQMGLTIRINPLEVMSGRRPSEWYQKNGKDGQWNTIHNSIREVFSRKGTVWGSKSHRYRYVVWIPVDGSGGSNGPPNFVGLTRLDVEGALGPERDTRWVGGLAHEIGHTFGLCHTGSTDNDVMIQGLYRFKMAVFSKPNIDQVLKDPHQKNWLVP